ncbi:hypothetical protein [Nocardioides sp. cx-173]|uniref:hypothetical protein n=1 Tax=Nocardioides sp. cx-173 TaxID=2898796 RepID=UPI001E2CE416|nr:hypothetical protein [Nocardioides sp. cx-173]MCD4526729.1 hypothetical protein [Nocardioides sp. cx-173]UGB42529.1 hypothetical protein LQ940_03150 [Nocardioides sp. cx-173]
MNEHETQPVQPAANQPTPDQPAPDQPAANQPAAPTGPQPPQKTSWRKRSLGAPIVAGVAALCLLLGGLGGAAVSAWADDDEPDGFGPGGRFQEHGHRGGPHGGPGMMMPPGHYGDDEYEGGQGGLPFGEQPDSELPDSEQPDSELPEAPESGTPAPESGDGEA